MDWLSAGLVTMMPFLQVELSAASTQNKTRTNYNKEGHTLLYSESSYLVTNADISMALEKQLNDCQMIILACSIKCCISILYKTTT